MSTVTIDMGDDDSSPKQKSAIMDDFMYNNNVAQANIYIRMGFLRKVYGILSVQLLITVVSAAICIFTPPYRLFIYNNDWMMNVALVMSVVLIIAMMIKRKEAPLNYILLFAFTLVQAYTITVVVSYYDQIIVLQAFVITLAVTLALTAYTFQSKHDFSTWHSALVSGLFILIATGLLQLFFWNSYLDLMVSIGGAALFSCFLIFDTHRIIHRLSPEEYILASIELYLDILNLFLYILRILNRKN